MNERTLSSQQSKLFQSLRSPWFLLLALATGVTLGINAPTVAKNIAFIGSIYLLMLKMCVLPILITGIITSVGRLMARTDATQYIKRIVFTFFACFVSLGIIGSALSVLAGAGRNLDIDTLQELGILVNQGAIDLAIPLKGAVVAEEAPASMLDFFLNTIPANIFDALSNGNTLQILVFVVIFGVALGILRRDVDKSEVVFDLLESIYQAFTKLNGWFIRFLPLGLFSLMAAQFSEANLVETIAVMVKFVLVVVMVFLVIYIISSLIIWRQAGCSLGAAFRAIQQPSIVALATSSALATMPVAISSLTDRLGFDRRATDMVMPLSIAIGRFGQIAYFVMASIFALQLYERSSDLGVIILVMVGSVLAGIASSGSTGLVTLSTLGIVLAALDIPQEASLLLFAAIDPFVDPFRTLCTLHTGMAATTLVAGAPRLGARLGVDGDIAELAAT